MWPVIRSILAVIAGFVAASAVMTVIETVNGRLLYPELAKLAEGVTDRETIASILASAPMGALLVVVLGWGLGSLAGGFLAAWIGRTAPLVHALVLGGLLTLAGVANNLMLHDTALEARQDLRFARRGQLAGESEQLCILPLHGTPVL